MAMWEWKKSLSLFSVLLFVLLVGALARVQKDEATLNLSAAEELQSSPTSTMAEKLEGLNEHAVDDPEEVARMVEMATRNSTERRKLGFFSCGTGNPIDDCWRCDANWQRNRKRLADCGIGFGRNAIGGRDGRYYVVTDPGDDDP
ncbi:UNVERIFIED_CONTAM: putative pectate lyase 8 [Sesamum latifolium]|uniref:Pectate lyase 8 n=1 Tax=Sesamum latifolium TaxID=2727402 RepID=A0AAW2VU61_9LAMI